MSRSTQLRIQMVLTATTLAWLAGLDGAPAAGRTPRIASSTDCGIFAVQSTGGIDIGGHLCTDGAIHANDELSGAERVRCGGFADNGYDIFPVAIVRTGPDDFPGGTWYRLVVTGAPGSAILQLRDRAGAILWSHPERSSPHPDLDWSLDAARVLTLSFRSTVPFDGAAGIFPVTPGDRAAVIDFSGGFTGEQSRTNLVVAGDGPTVRATLVNARYGGGSDPRDRANRANWIGGETRIKGRPGFAPVLGLGLIVKDFVSSGPVELGSPSDPIAIYATGSVSLDSSRWILHGSLFALGDVRLGGNGTVTTNTALADRVPAFLAPWPVACATPFPAPEARPRW